MGWSSLPGLQIHQYLKSFQQVVLPLPYHLLSGRKGPRKMPQVIQASRGHSKEGFFAILRAFESLHLLEHL